MKHLIPSFAAISLAILLFAAGYGLAQYNTDRKAEQLHHTQVLDSLHKEITLTRQLYHRLK